ncbi:MAG: nucleotidyltransferase family protein [Rhodospirillales bacterium]
MLIPHLLRYAADGMPGDGTADVAAAVETAAPGEVGHALAAGLGPLLRRACQAVEDRLAPPLRNALIGTDLTARFRHHDSVEGAKAAVDICADLGVPVVLLKGISVSGQCYPVGHLRPMGDVDLLVPASAATALEAAFLLRGYRPSLDKMGPGAHHRKPLLDPERPVWIELHTTLFPADSPLQRGRLFNPDEAIAQCADAHFHDRPAGRLGDELQLAYIASYWVRDISMHGIHPGFVMPVVDAAALLAASGARFDWDRLLASLDNPLAAASLLILLSSLSRYHGVDLPSRLLARLSATQDLIGRPERTIIEAMVHANLIGGRPFGPVESWHLWSNLIRPGRVVGKLLALPWNILFPPSRPQRYNLGWQAARITRRFRPAGPQSWSPTPGRN